MNYNEIRLVIINKSDKKNISPNDIFPSISNVFQNCIIKKSLREIKLSDIVNNKNEYFYFKNKECHSLNEKIKSFFIYICRKKFRAPLCSYRKIVSDTLLHDTHRIKIITLSTFHLFDLIKFHTKNYKFTNIHFDFSTFVSDYLWFLDNLKNSKNFDTKICIVYNCFSLSFIKYLNRIYPNAKIISRYHDMIMSKKHKNFITKNKHKFKNVLFETYSLKDSLQLKINYWANSVDFYSLNNLKSSAKQDQYDIYFLGGANSARLSFLKELLIKFNKYNIKFYIDFVVFDKEQRSQVKRNLNQLFDLKINDSKVNTDPVNYSQYLRNFANAKLIIDLYRLSPDEGLSFRTAEALALKKKIITNRDLNANNLYKFKENILSFDDIDKVNLRKFIDKPYVDPDPELLKQFDINEQIKNYLKN